MTDPGQILGRGISFPPRIGGDGRVTWSEGADNITDAIKVILQTDRNERLRLSAFGAGLGLLLFEPNTVATQRLLQERILNALTAWEPRITVQSVDVEPDPNDPEAAIATIQYKLVATQATQQISLSVQLG
ncbi:MAG TPA: GPW/gp25 family protein [Solirubrobacteraceae bacterium]|nr:GPW/gp25 family protein [Solirubrobacteraceae bacterium]